MRFVTPDDYTVIFQGQLINAKGGVIETDNKALIDQLSKNPRVSQEKQQAKPKPKTQGA